MFTVDMPFSLPNPNSPTNGDAGNADPIRQNFQSIASAIQSFDGAQIQAATVAEAALAANINPRVRDADMMGNFIVAGTGNTAVTWSIVSGLNATMTGGNAYIQGYRVTIAALASRAFSINLDTYVDIDYLGNIAYPTAANNATAPAVTANSVRVAKVVTNGTAIVSITTKGYDSLGNSIRPTGGVNASKIDFSSYVQSQGAGGANAVFSDGGFNDLSTPVSVSAIVPASGKVALMWSARIYNATNDNQTFVSFAATGANVIASTDLNAASSKVIAGSSDSTIARVKYLTGLTPGVTVFKLQRRNTNGNVTITNADLIVIPVYE